MYRTGDETDLPAWEGPMQTLFDDGIDPAAVGLSLDGTSPADDPLLPARVEQADLVARMRVSTVTVDSVGAKTTYLLTLQVGFPTLAPPRVKDTTVDIAIDPSRPSFPIVRSLDTELRGKVFVGFVRYFASDGGPEPHWHLTADTQPVLLAVERIVAFGAADTP